MFIKHDPPIASLVHEGKTYEADQRGIVDVPEEVGRVLVGRAGFSQYLGEDDEPTIEQEDARVSELENEVDRLRAALAKATKPKPAKRSAESASALAKDAPKGDSEGGDVTGDEPKADADSADEASKAE